jgi:MmgE/PrpD N-terminal domain
MRFPRRRFLRLAAGAGAVPFFCRMAQSENGAPTQSEPHQPPLAKLLAAYADGLRYDHLDDATVESVKVHLIDSLGCGLAAFDEKPVRICRDVVLASGGGSATIIGTKRHAAPDLAAFANCAAFRYLDLNDAYVGRITGHPSDDIAACLAVAEAERSSAPELITAIALAYEINCRLIDAFGIEIGSRGWDVPVLSLPAVALAAGKLMKLTPDKLEQAINLALNDHISMGQTRAQTLSDWKGIADAEAGRNAVFAAMLARGGLTGPAPIFEPEASRARRPAGCRRRGVWGGRAKSRASTSGCATHRDSRGRDKNGSVFLAQALEQAAKEPNAQASRNDHDSPNHALPIRSGCSVHDALVRRNPGLRAVEHERNESVSSEDQGSRSQLRRPAGVQEPVCGRS